MIHFKDNKNKSSALTTRWAQMSKQEQIIERKKMEIQAKLEAQQQAAALAAQAKLINPSTNDETGSNNIFSNDGSFMSQYKALIEKQKKEKEEKEEKERQEALEEDKKNKAEVKVEKSDDHGCNENQGNANNRRSSKDRQRRWGDRGKNRSHSPTTPVVEDRKKNLDHKNIPSLMQIPVMPPEPPSPPSNSGPWTNDDSNDPYDSDHNSQSNNNPPLPDPAIMPPGPMGPGPMGFGPMGPSMMGPGPMGMGMGMGPGPGPAPMGPMGPGPGPMGPGPGPMGPGPGPMGPGHGPMGPGPGPMGPGPMGGRFMGPGGNGPMSNNGPNMGPGRMMGRGGPMPPFMGGPPNFPPNFMGPGGPNGPGGPCGPGPMPPNMCGPNMRGPGPNGPMPPFFPPFCNPQMMRPNGPPNSMIPPNSMMPPITDNSANNNMPFMGPRPPFGPNGPNFAPGGPNGSGPPNVPFMPPNSMLAPMPPNSLQGIPEPKPLDTANIPQPEPMKLQNIPSPVPLQLNHIPKPKEMDPGNIPTPNPMQVLSADGMPPAVHRAAAEVASNGDQWENVLKAIHSQDQNMWFLHNPNSNEYQAFRNLVNKIRNERPIKPEVKPEDKYEPEFSLEDDDSNDGKPIKQEGDGGYQDSNNTNPYLGNIKNEHTSSQSDDDSEVKRERRKRKKSRWGDDPPVTDIKPPGVLAGLPVGLPGAKLSKIDEGGIKLSSLNKNNPALLQYAMTNYGTTNLSPEDWAKCEDNFKLNLLYQDMLKKREEVERLNAAGKNKYEYDSDEDTSEGTWEHRLRAKEMCATEKWATELTKQAAGKHHIGDFLPPEELKKFMEKYSAAKGGKEPDLSDYKEYKLKEDNVGFKMLQKLGWNEGQGLGAEGTGIVDPINKANQPVANLGLGAASSDAVSAHDDEFDAYRKRMMLAYRFRPNPLNNPRRPYY